LIGLSKKWINRLPTDRSTKENLYLLLWRMKINPALSYFIMQSENKICNSNLFFIEINWKEPQLIDRIITFLIKKYLKLFVILLWKKNNSKSFKTVWLICISNGILHLQKLSQLWLASSLFVFNLLALTRNQNHFENGKRHFNWQNVIAFRSNLKCFIHNVIRPHYLLNNRTYSYYCYCYILHSKGWALKPDRCLIRWQVSTPHKKIQF
jgi:hypothetical protein